ncbi:hypothetical protein PAPB9_05877 [Pseudomonas aeruginosa]|nr:hypothetical protein PAPB9_05877 [Pseudomonas aeruginosa]
MPLSTAPSSRSSGSPCVRGHPCCWWGRPVPANRSSPGASMNSSAAGTSSTGVSSRSTAPPCAATARCRHCSVTSRAPSPARRMRAKACCAQPTVACCSSTRSASWAPTNRRCCSRLSKRSASSRWVRTVRWRATSSLSPGPTATCADEWPKACSARTCSPASTCGPSSCRAWLDAEDIEPNIDFELERHAREQGRQVRFNLEAKRRYLAFAGSSEARWAGNFRELSASITRMATLADSGRIDEALVEEEILRLRQAWGLDAGREPLADLLGQRVEALDLFDRLQLQAVLEVCRGAKTLSEAGRRLFAVSRQDKRNPNDADRLRKYLARFGLDWAQIRA